MQVSTPEDAVGPGGFDEAFVAGATYHEPAAGERARPVRRPLPPPSRRARRAELRRRARAVRSAAIRRQLRNARPWLVSAVVIGAIALVPLPGSGAAPGRPGGITAGFGVGDSTDWPTPERAASTVPLGTPQHHPDVVDGYRFAATAGDGAPVTFDPCRPIRYVVNERTAPPGSAGLLDGAIATVSDVTGLRFEAAGLTDEPPTQPREAFQPDRYGDRWAPVLVAWSDPIELPALAGDVAGIGGATRITSGDQVDDVYVSGIVALDGAKLGLLLGRPGGEAGARGVLLHELAHLVGLGHVDDPAQLLHARSPQVELQAGDLAGLSRLGGGRCFRRL
jgi:hypothetical protein